MRNCKNCGKECLSIYCCHECNRTYKEKHFWRVVNCKICGKEMRCRLCYIKKYCSVKCMGNDPEIIKKKLESCKKTCLKKYGNESIMKTEFGKLQLKKSVLKKYGVDHFSKTKEFLEKFRNTCKGKYGVDYPMQCSDVKRKSKETCNEKYGGFTLEKKSSSNKKMRNTMLEKYGTEHSMQNPISKKKAQDTNRKKYGSISPLSNKEVRKKTIETLKSKYGKEVINISQVKEIRDSIIKKFLDQFYESLLSDRLNNQCLPLFSREEYSGIGYYKIYPFQCTKCNEKFNDFLYGGKVPRCPVCFPPNVSKPQEEIFEFIKSLLPTGRILKNNKKLLPSKKELDIYVPSKKIAIEFDGIHWHSENSGKKNKLYHRNKTEECNSIGIRLIHIFENEWMNKPNIVRRKLVNLFGSCEDKKIFARKCEIKEITTNEKNNFLEEYHMQGKDSSSIRLGAFYENKLVAVMTFGNLRFALGNKKGKVGHYEMYRFCVGEIPVIGVAGKLFQYFVRNYKPSSVISYADRRYSDETAFYSKIGFSFTGMTPPNYWYFNKKLKTKLYHRFPFRKDQLPSKLEVFDPNLSEWENMLLNGYDRIWDCGNLKFEWTE